MPVAYPAWLLPACGRTRDSSSPPQTVSRCETSPGDSETRNHRQPQTEEMCGLGGVGKEGEVEGEREGERWEREGEKERERDERERERWERDGRERERWEREGERWKREGERWKREGEREHVTTKYTSNQRVSTFSL